MTIELTREQERLIEDVLESGTFRDPDDVISAAPETLIEELPPDQETVNGEPRFID